MSTRLEDLDAVFVPRRVAVVGASDEPGKVGTTLMRNLGGFDGEVVPISSSREEVGGRRAFKRLRDVPGGVDLAVAAVPAKAIEEVVQDAAAAGAGAVVVLSGGFAETGPAGAELQERVVAAARAGGVHVHRDIYVSIAGTDLVRLEDGKFVVLEDNLRVPSM